MRYIILICTFFLLATSLYAKKIKEIRIKHHADITGVRYGDSFKVEIRVVFSNGKTQKARSKHGKVTVKVTGGRYSGNKIYVERYPTSLDFNSVIVEASLVTEKGKTFEKKLTVPLTFNGEINLDFAGDNGADGEKGDSKGTPLIFRDGNDGDDGEEGENGGDGRDLSVWIWKKTNYMIKVQDNTSGEIFWYQKEDAFSDLIIDVAGGNGGNGGNGGDGGTGKDGKITENKNKDPGDGGNGGNGGAAGNGGNGGSVVVVVHPSAEDIQAKVVIKNFGGAAGRPGEAGEAGSPGDPLDGQEEGTAGYSGIAGIEGTPGLSGSSTDVKLEEFTIE